MRSTPRGTGMSCRYLPYSISFKLVALFFFLLLQFVARAQTQYWQPTGSDISNTNTGNVGIGTSNPNAKLEVAGNLLFLTGVNQMYLNGGYLLDKNKAGFRCNAGDVVLNSKDNGSLYLNRDVNSDTYIESSPNGVDNVEIATFLHGGNVGIGTTTPKAKLAVNGDILAKQVVVSLNNLPDYVFNDEYHLLSLDSVNSYIRSNHHLPGMPSADSVARRGLDLGENQAALLKKVEELTLYVIQQQRELEELKAENKKLAQAKIQQ